MSDQTPRSPQESLNRIVEILEKLEKQTAPPPVWKKVLKFTFEHFLVIISILTIALGTWKIWGIVGGISGKMNDITGSVPSIESIKDKASNGIDDVKSFFNN